MRIVTSAAVIMFVACSQAGEETGALMTDSAGVPIVTSSAPMWSPDERWTVDLTPRLTIGGGDDESQQLYQVTGAALLSDGRVVIANNGSSEVRYYDQSGTLTRRVGQSGAGPGEFGYMAAFGLLSGDTIAVADANHQRLTVLDPDGRVVATEQFPRGFAAMAEAIMLDGSVVVSYADVENLPSGKIGVNTFSRFYAIVPRGAAAADTLGLFPMMQSWLPEGRADYEAAFMPMGLQLIVAARDRIFMARSTESEIRAFDHAGQLVAIFRIHRSPEPASSRHMTAARRQLERITRMPPDQRRAILEVMEEVPIPETLPPIEAIVPATTGHLWVRRFHGDPDTPATWMVLDAEGVWLGDVALPGDAELLFADGAFLLLLRRDVDGLERVEQVTVTRLTL